MTSEKTISVEGHEGLQFDGKMFHFDADEDVNILSNLVSKCCLDILFSSCHNLVTTPRTLCCKSLIESPGLIFVHSNTLLVSLFSDGFH